MEDRDRDLLARDVLSDLLLEAQKQGDQATLDTLSDLSLRLNPDGAQRFLMRCANAQELWTGQGGWQPPMDGHVRRVLGLAEDASEASLARLCSDEEFAVEALKRCRATLSDWNSATGRNGTAAIDNWLAKAPLDRVGALKDFFGTLLTKGGRPNRLENVLKRDPDYEQFIDEVIASISAVEEQRTLLELAQFLTPALTLGRKFAFAWQDAKTREGLIDFDDQIREAARLLNNGEMAEWIRYKLDREFDHVLVDEAQDTNEAQWSIIDALTDEFYAGLGQRDDRYRTLFVVGDYKQAIFRFQGTSPENFHAAKERYKTKMDQAADNALQLRSAIRPKRLQEYGLGRSFRSSNTILDFVNRALDTVGFEQLGLDKVPEEHKGDDRPGLVALWPPVKAAFGDDDDVGDGSGSEIGEGWLPPSDRIMADTIAMQVRQWMDAGFPLVKGEKPGSARRAKPGDVMVLVRKRRDLAGLIVARLHAAAVPVAGVDRLRLGNPLAVKDLLAALRFAVQPADDLSLANLLVSPIMGWSQEDLLEHGYRAPDSKITLWDHLRDGSAPIVIETVEKLRELLRKADFDTPLSLLHWMLVGPWRARANLLARLGSEAADPIDELLNAAQGYEAAHTPSLQSFLHWFDAGDGELKRESEGGSDEVRVMTVHGSKGLQAPIVILADATGRLDDKLTSDINLDVGDGEARAKRSVPIPPLRSDKRVGVLEQIAEREKIEEAKEHLRLLYVAMTRAEEALFIGGALGKSEDEPHESSWYARLAPLFEDAALIQSSAWQQFGEVKQLGVLAQSPVPAKAEAVSDPIDQHAIPDWAQSELRAEPRPPRPLAPSSAGEDDTPSPPRDLAADPSAAERGVLIHALLERLPDIAPGKRRAMAEQWVTKHGANFDAGQQADMIESALAVIDQPGWDAIFAPGSMAEVPLAANLGEEVVYGIADRLLVTEDAVTVVDYKTTKRPPETAAAIPRQTLRQMAAYVCALERIYPNRTIKAAVLYTHTPSLFELSDDALAPHKRSLLGVE